jgi:hypothetical protein
MTRTPLAVPDNGAPAYDDAGALTPGSAEDGGEDAAQAQGDMGDLVHIADLGEPLVVAISGAEAPILPAEPDMPAQAQDAGETSVASSAPPVGVASVVSPGEPRRVPVLTIGQPEEQTAPERGPARVVPVLSTEAPSADGAASTVEQARVAEPSLR